MWTCVSFHWVLHYGSLPLYQFRRFFSCMKHALHKRKIISRYCVQSIFRCHDKMVCVLDNAIIMLKHFVQYTVTQKKTPGAHWLTYAVLPWIKISTNNLLSSFKVALRYSITSDHSAASCQVPIRPAANKCGTGNPQVKYVWQSWA